MENRWIKCPKGQGNAIRPINYKGDCGFAPSVPFIVTGSGRGFTALSQLANAAPFPAQRTLGKAPVLLRSLPPINLDMSP